MCVWEGRGGVGGLAWAARRVEAGRPIAMRGGRGLQPHLLHDRPLEWRPRPRRRRVAMTSPLSCPGGRAEGLRTRRQPTAR